ncbi:MAG: UDP-2,3-diacylglucosamine diphosphatase [bacterium]
MRTRFRTIFLSDTHLGFRGVATGELSALLKHTDCERLYLVGDILDLWALKQRWHWPAAHNQVVRRILKHAKRGAHVVYIPGNHDDGLRQYAGLDLGGVRIARQAVHRTADGRSLLVTHGDEYDLVVQHSKLLSLLGTWAYDHLILLNRLTNWLRGLVGLAPWSFAKAVKLKVKGACTFLSDFQTALMAEAKRRNLDGVVCGHVHQAALVTDASGLLYANCGDWLEKPTALVEHDDGRLEILDVRAFLVQAGITTDANPAEEVLLDEAEDAAASAIPGLLAGAVA